MVVVYFGFCAIKNTITMNSHIKTQEWEQIIAILRTRKDIKTRKKCTAVMPPTKNRKHQRNYDEHVYKERHLIECFFGKNQTF